MNAVVYVRAMANKATLDNGLATQLRECLSYAVRHGYEVAKVFQEQGKDMKATDGTEFQTMLSYCEEHGRDLVGVIVPSVSCFARNMKDFVARREELKRVGLRLLLVEREQDDTPDQGFVDTMAKAFIQLGQEDRAARGREREANGCLH